MTLAVVDTGVLVAGLYCLNEPHRCLRAWQQRVFQLAVSDAIFDEYYRVAWRVKAEEGLPGDLEPFLGLIREHALWVSPEPLRRRVCRDPKDDKFLEAAFAAHAPMVIARDPDLTDLEKPFGIKIVTPCQPRQHRDARLLGPSGAQMRPFQRAGKRYHKCHERSECRCVASACGSRRVSDHALECGVGSGGWPQPASRCRAGRVVLRLLVSAVRLRPPAGPFVRRRARPHPELLCPFAREGVPGGRGPRQGPVSVLSARRHQTLPGRRTRQGDGEEARRRPSDPRLGCPNSRGALPAGSRPRGLTRAALRATVGPRAPGRGVHAA